MTRGSKSKLGFQDLQEVGRCVCSRDLQERPIIPFGGPGTIEKCDESKFNHKAKVSHFHF